MSNLVEAMRALSDMAAMLGITAKEYDPNQPRDESGKWTDSGGGTGAISDSTSSNKYKPPSEGDVAFEDKINQGKYKDEWTETQQVMYHWTASAKMPSSVALEAAAAARFGGEIRAGEMTFDQNSARRYFQEASVTPVGNYDDYNKYISHQYHATQEALSGKYKTGNVTLYRGLRNRDGRIPSNGEIEIEMDALSSWTGSISKAKDFATAFSQVSNGRILSMNIPIKDILASPESSKNLFDYGESEFVVIGRGATRKAKIEWASQ